VSTFRNSNRSGNNLEAYLSLLSPANTTPSSDKMMELRKLVLREGLPDDAHQPLDVFGGMTLRTVVWKLLLGSLYMDVDRYITLVKVQSFHTTYLTL
tara:strand:- start:651 stop:941 length:291 start_codon:yes stop_codon:yes gene_type:complete